MDPDPTYRYGPGSIPDVYTMDDTNPVNPNGQPQLSNLNLHTPDINILNDCNDFDFMTDALTEHSHPQSESESSRLFSYPAVLLGQHSSQTSDDLHDQQATNFLSLPHGQPVREEHLHQSYFWNTGAHLASLPADDTMPQALDIPGGTSEEPFPIPIEQSPLDPRTGHSNIPGITSQQTSSHVTQQRLYRDLSICSHNLHSALAGRNLSLEGLNQQMWRRVQQQIQSLDSLIPQVNRFAQGIQTPSLEEPPVARETIEPADVKEAQIPGKSLRYRCKESGCPSKIFHLATTFQRHVEALHYPKSIFYCPVKGSCKPMTRRDKVLPHAKDRHLKEPTADEINQHKISRPCPPKCRFCMKQVRGWGDFYKCFMSHCVVEDDSADDSQPTTHQSHPPDEGDGGAGPAYGHHSSIPDSEPGSAGGMTLNNDYGGSADSTQGYGLQSNQYGFNQLGSNPSPALDNRSFSGGGGPPPQQYPTPSIQEHRRGSTGALLRRQVARPPPEQPTQSSREDLKCQICPHTVCNTNCTLRRTTRGCHYCAPQLGAHLLSNRNALPRGSAAAQRPFHTVRRLQQPRFIGHPRANILPSGNDTHQNPQPRYRNNNHRGRGSQQPRGGPSVMMVTNIPEPDLSECGLLSASRLKATKVEPTALWLPFRGLPKSLAKILQPGCSKLDEETPSVHINLPNLSSSPLVTPAPVFECRCPCVLKAKDASYSHQAQLTPGKILDVNMKFVAEERTGHPLRTRIRVVVKLFKLRSSVTRSGNKLKSKEDAKVIKNVLETSLDKPALVMDSEHHEQRDEGRDDPEDSEISDEESDCIFSDTDSQISSASDETVTAHEGSEPLVDLHKKHDPSEDLDLLFPDDADGVDSRINDDYRFEHASDRRLDQDGEIASSDDELSTPIASESHILSMTDTVAFEDIERTELEFSIDLDARAYLGRLSTWTDSFANVDLEDLSQDNSNDPERVFQYFFRYLLYVIFTLSRSRYYSPSSLLE